ncbi:MAG: 16S rRNA methyltransferase [Candidatus Thorarchaeota archaeon]
MPLIIIFVECGIELIPKEIRNHSAVRKNLSPRIYSSQLLDNALHHTAMKRLTNLEKRGRPDIVHLCLLNALGSPLNKTRNLEIFIHTIKNKIFKFNPEIRIARNYNRFKGLMAKLLIDKNITINGTQLISEFEGDLKDLINLFNNPEVYLLSSRGKSITKFKDIFTEDLSKNIIIIIGGFQKSSFSKNILMLSKNIGSISQFPLDAWIVTNKIITYYELHHKIQ